MQSRRLMTKYIPLHDQSRLMSAYFYFCFSLDAASAWSANYDDSLKPAVRQRFFPRIALCPSGKFWAPGFFSTAATSARLCCRKSLVSKITPVYPRSILLAPWRQTHVCNHNRVSLPAKVVHRFYCIWQGSKILCISVNYTIRFEVDPSLVQRVFHSFFLAQVVKLY